LRIQVELEGSNGAPGPSDAPRKRDVTATFLYIAFLPVSAPLVRKLAIRRLLVKALVRKLAIKRFPVTPL